MTPAAAWQLLRDAGIAGGEPPETQDVDSPWYVRAMLGAAGWVAALFLLGFVYAVIGEDLSHGGMIVAGGVLIAAAAGLLTAGARNDFAAQLGLAGAFAGQGLAFFGLYATLREMQLGEVGVYLVLAAAEIVLLLAIAHPLHRTWCAFAAAGFLWFAAGRVVPFATVLLAAAMAVLWLVELERPRVHALLAPAAYGVTFALLAAEAYRISVYMFLSTFDVRDAPIRLQGLLSPWIGQALMALVLVGVAWRLCRRPNLRPTREQVGAALLAAVLIAMVSRPAPGIISAVMVIVLGFGNGNRVLAGLGVTSLLAAVFAFYYNLDTTLLVKSGLLAISGVVLLAFRAAVFRWRWPEAEPGHA